MNAADRSLEVRRQRTDRLTRVGPGTEGGAYLRRFWHPVAAATELHTWPIKKIRILGEDLALFRCEDGTLGLLADRCPHRGASLSCGMTDGSGLRCAYHGWAFDTSGQCTDTPAEPSSSTLKSRIKTAGYPVTEQGGLLWAYFGPQPAPLLPRYEHVVRNDLAKTIGFTYLPCNWVQIAENSVDPAHVEFLHMKFLNWTREQLGASTVGQRHHERIDFEPFEYGILKKRLWKGDSEDSEEWQVGHPLIFPGTLFVPITATWVEWQFRVPIDDENTLIFWYDAKVPDTGESIPENIPFVPNPWQSPDGLFYPDRVNAQDMMMWITQGAVTDHRLEHLAESDRGVALYRRTLLEQFEKVARGEDPLGVVRDPAKNTPYITLPIERTLGYTLTGVNTGMYEFPERELVLPND